MIVVRVELHSARTHEVTELARMHICNEGGTRDLGDYGVYVLRGRSKAALDKQVIQRRGEFGKFPRLRVHVWNLVLYALVSAGYGAVGEGKLKPVVPPEPPDALRHVETAVIDAAIELTQGELDRSNVKDQFIGRNSRLAVAVAALLSLRQREAA